MAALGPVTGPIKTVFQVKTKHGSSYRQSNHVRQQNHQYHHLPQRVSSHICTERAREWAITSANGSRSCAYTQWLLLAIATVTNQTLVSRSCVRTLHIQPANAVRGEPKNASSRTHTRTHHPYMVVIAAAVVAGLLFFGVYTRKRLSVCAAR